MPAIVNTELATGLPDRRAVKSEPEDVAEAIVEALKTPRSRSTCRNPGNGNREGDGSCRAAREAVGRAMGADKIS